MSVAEFYSGISGITTDKTSEQQFSVQEIQGTRREPILRPIEDALFYGVAAGLGKLNQGTSPGVYL